MIIMPTTPSALASNRNRYKSRLSGYKKALGSVRGALRGPGRITEMNTSSAKERMKTV